MNVAELVGRVVGRVAPTWPLDRFIAVNPFWEQIDQPLSELSPALSALSGTRLLMPRAWYRDQHLAGSIDESDIARAIHEAGTDRRVSDVLGALATEPSIPRRKLLVDVADEERDLAREPSWQAFVTNHVSRTCAAYFDEAQAGLPASSGGALYDLFLRHLSVDRSPRLLMDFRECVRLAHTLPSTPSEMIERALRDLDVREEDYESYLSAVLLAVLGWASVGAHRRWLARLEQNERSFSDPSRDILAMRIAWEWLLHRGGDAKRHAAWRRAMTAWPSIDAEVRASQADDWLIHRAFELHRERELCRALTRHSSPVEGPDVQIAFCIDVRSEPMRRALEAEGNRVQTIGFAGFFGLPIAYRAAGSSSARPQLPALLAPRFEVSDAGPSEPTVEAWTRRLQTERATADLRARPSSGFAYVEALGWLAAGALVAETSQLAAGNDARIANAKPRLATSLDDDARAELCAGILRSMSLTHGFARLVLMVGHTSRSRNNPHAAGLACGACGGQSGEVNARVLCALLNESAVREGLARRRIEIPSSTRFVPGLHDTTTDEVVLFDLDELPASHAGDIGHVRGWLDRASERTRRERAPRLGLVETSPHALRDSYERRARNWAETRPEWGLANNRAFVAAPRARTRGLDLAGRVFLHEYRWSEDVGFRVLESIMTAPLVVAHWINMQYLASTVDNGRYGSGNKTLHNVVGAHLGVLEGSGGDLRIGLPLQSVHDGERWMHEPLRLGAFIEAPQDAIADVVRRHEQVRALVENGWCQLFQIDSKTGDIHRFRKGCFEAEAA